VLTEALGIEVGRYRSDLAFPSFFQHVNVAALCTAICDWTIAQMPCGAMDLGQLVCDSKTLRGSIEQVVTRSVGGYSEEQQRRRRC
jgi:hypothetical protein